MGPQGPKGESGKVIYPPENLRQAEVGRKGDRGKLL